MSGNQLSFLPQGSPSSRVMALYFDGAARNNPGPAGAGIVFKNDSGFRAYYCFYLGEKTNNQAEYLAVILGLLIAKEYKAEYDTLEVYGDSELLIKQMSGHYRVKNPMLQHLSRVVYLLSNGFSLSFTHVSRTYNKDADRLANQAIDTKAPIPDKYKRELDEYRITL